MRRMYSENQLKELILKDFESQNVKVKTISQSEANFSYKFEIELSDMTNFEKYGTQYCKAEVVNGELHIIMCASFKNKDASAHNANIAYQDITLPEEIGSKIFDLGGNNITQSPSDITLVRIAPIGFQGSSIGIMPIALRHLYQNKLTIYQPSSQNVNAGDIISYTCEVNLSILD